jgi:peptidoglycan hydrolase CwlO-like protein
MQTSVTTQQNGTHVHSEVRLHALAAAIQKVIAWIGSPASLIVHTIAFAACFSVSLLHWVDWNLMLTVLTNVVSLEAIYLAIFIQFSVNQQAKSLRGVEEDVESIQEDVEELGEHVEGIKEDVEDIQEDIGEISEDAIEELRKRTQAQTLEALSNDVRAMLQHIESLKTGSNKPGPK